MQPRKTREGGHISFWKDLSRRLRRRAAEADFRHFALGRRADLKKLARFKIKHAGNNIGRELCDFRIEVAYYCVVVTPRILHTVFNLVQSILKLSERLHRAQLWIRFRQGE